MTLPATMLATFDLGNVRNDAGALCFGSASDRLKPSVVVAGH